MTTRKRPGPRPRLSSAAIVDAVLAEAQDVGFGSVTITALATRLSVRHSALYRYVSSIENAAELAAESLIDDLDDIAPDSDWRAALSSVATSVFAILSEYPGLDIVLRRSPQAQRKIAGRSGLLVKQLMAEGFSPHGAVLSADLVMNLTYESAASATLLRRGRDEIVERARASWSADMDPDVVDAMLGTLAADPADWFAEKLALALAGIATLRNRVTAQN